MVVLWRSEPDSWPRWMWQNCLLCPCPSQGLLHTQAAPQVSWAPKTLLGISFCSIPGIAVSSLTQAYRLMWPKEGRFVCFTVSGMVLCWPATGTIGGPGKVHCKQEQTPQHGRRARAGMKVSAKIVCTACHSNASHPTWAFHGDLFSGVTVSWTWVGMTEALWKGVTADMAADKHCMMEGSRHPMLEPQLGKTSLPGFKYSGRRRNTVPQRSRHTSSYMCTHSHTHGIMTEASSCWKNGLKTSHNGHLGA